VSEQPPIPVTIRSFTPADAAVCKRLYEEGLIDGKLAENDTGVDIDDIPGAYMSRPGSHFWVAEDESGQVVGMIGVQQHESGEGEIKRLRVRPDRRRRGVGTAMLEAALKFCQEKHHLKVVLDTHIDHEAALKLFAKFRFKLSRTRALGDKTLMYFYLDLYTGDRPGAPKAS
jgi:ribosomal protein S18 acetylase RimI-like enzyme